MSDGLDTPHAPDAAAEARRLAHELGVHQVELELQNEQLRQTHLLLETSRDRYQDLYEQAPVGYVRFNFDGLIVEANRLARALLGGTSAKPLTGRRMTDFIAEADQPAFTRCLSALARGAGRQQLELRATPDGGTADMARWLSMQLVLVPEDPGGTQQCRATLSDVTEHVRLQQHLAQLAAIVASSDDAIISADLERRITSWNDGAERLFGHRADEMLGHLLDALVPPERRTEESALLRRLRAGERLNHIETERRHRDGHRVPVSLSMAPLFDASGQACGVSVIARDITERKRGERALHQRLRQLNLLSQAGQALIMGVPDADGTVKHELFDRVRQAVGGEIHLHYALGQVPGTLRLSGCHGLSQPARTTMQVVAIDASPCGTVVQRGAPLVIEQLQNSPLHEVAALKAEGARCYAGFPLLAGGKVCGVAAFASTTRERFREGDLQVIQTVCDQVSAMLERSRLMSELQAREQSLREADRRKDDFIATLAHELRNPLAPIRTAVAVLRHSEVGDAQLALCRDIIDRQVVQMSHLLEDLLDVSRVTRNRIELRRETFPLQRAVEQALETARPLTDAQRHRLSLQMPLQPVLVHADLTRLTQVLANLIHNAAKYTDAEGCITVTLERHGDEAVVTVRDSGVGIEPGQLDHVFDMFAQLEPTLERSHGGLGIGLSLARGLAELHGGHLEAHSEGRGSGSTFTLRLPVLAASAPAPAGAAAPAAEFAPPHAAAAATDGAADSAPAPHRILVIDDNVDACRTLGALLQLKGQDVRTAFGGLEGLQLAEHWRPDIAVVDIGMPDLNGYELCRRLRRESWGAAMMLIACTGWGQQEDRDRATEAGFDAHLVKPVEPAALMRLVEQSQVPQVSQ
jgi:PAS domain S-box-containing protein